jgi:hypothetical protein
MSSEIISEFGLESMVANDFVFDVDATITRCIGVGGYHSWAPGDPEIHSFNFKFYLDAEGRPGDLLVEYLGVVPDETFLGNDGFGRPTYQYEYDVSVPVVANTTYWFVLQADDHDYPPQWGRQEALSIIGSQAMFWSPYFSYPEWTPVSEIWDFAFDVAQSFECDVPVATELSTMGRMKLLYR